MSDEDLNDRAGTGHAVAWAVVALIVLPFVPLLLSLSESLLFHTTHVEDACRKLGIHDALSKLYNPLFSLLSKLLRR